MDLEEKTIAALLISCIHHELSGFCPLYKDKNPDSGDYICADKQTYGKAICGFCMMRHFLKQAEDFNLFEEDCE